jgi:hypothetical protein
MADIIHAAVKQDADGCVVSAGLRAWDHDQHKANLDSLEGSRGWKGKTFDVPDKVDGWDDPKLNAWLKQNEGKFITVPEIRVVFKSPSFIFDHPGDASIWVNFASFQGVLGFLSGADTIPVAGQMRVGVSKWKDDPDIPCYIELPKKFTTADHP